MSSQRFLGLKITPLTRRRLYNFRANRRGFWSLWVFLAVFGFTLFAEVVANDKPILIRYDGAFYFPIATSYSETTFGGDFPTEADYHDPTVVENNDFVHIGQRGKTVGDTENSPAFFELIDCLLNFRFRVGIQGGGGFVEDEDRGIP